MTLDSTIMVVFVISLAGLVYTYAGYPVLVFSFSRLFRRPTTKNEVEPTVTVLITAFNEEASIAAKIENTLEIEYPEEKLDILVASDGSTDKTDEIVKGFADRGVILFRQEGRKGKTYTQNKAVERAGGEIILFSDATTEYSPDVLRRLLPVFADEGVGCAAGKLVYVDRSNSDVGAGAKKYWGYESFLKQSESDACSLIGASGCIYAVRKSAYRPMYPEACSDFLICTYLYEDGLRSVYVPEAVCFEETNTNIANELNMRIRVISQTFTDLWRNRHMMNPFRSGFYAVQLISHKLFRYSVPVLLILLFVSTAWLSVSSLVFRIALLFQFLFYGTGLVALVLERFRFRVGIFSIPMYFIIANYASFAGFYRFLKGDRYASWNPIRENSGAKDQA